MDKPKIVGDDWAPLDDAKVMPVNCPTPEGCRPNGCHGACLPQNEPSKAETRTLFEEWARYEAELDIRHRDTDSPLDRQQYDSWVTALAWKAWNASITELLAWSASATELREGLHQNWCDHSAVSTGRRSSAVELALRLVRYGASPADAAKLAGCHVRSVHRALKALEMK
jgi:hypothetical protein